MSSLAVAVEEQPADRVAALFDAHHQRLYRLARRLTSSADDALDLVQETFLRAAGAPGSVPSGTEREEAWLVRVLINLRRDQWRKAAVQKRHNEHSARPSSQFNAESDHGSAAILIDGEVVMAPVIRSAISNSALITGTFTRADAERIADGIGTR